MKLSGQRAGQPGKDRSGVWLLLAGILLILGNKPGSFSADAGDKPDIQGQAAQDQREDTAKPAGCIQIAGSSSMESYVSALAEGFMERYPDITVTVQFTGSSAGIAAAAAGRADIGISSRYLKEEEKEAGVTGYVAGFDGIALCVNPANGVSGVTREELCGIYTGETRSWAELGGCDLPVVAVGREAGSGTRAAFEELLGLEGGPVYANEMDSTGAAMARILATPGAIGYVSFEAAGRAQGERIPGQEAVLSVLCLDGTVPSPENVRNGSYPLYRPFVMAVRGEAASQNSLVRLWFAYVGSEEGRKIAGQAGIADCAGSQ